MHLWKSDQKKRKEKYLQIAGTAAARVQRVHLHLSISSNGCIAPFLMKNVQELALFQLEKELLGAKNVVQF